MTIPTELVKEVDEHGVNLLYAYIGLGINYPNRPWRRPDGGTNFDNLSFWPRTKKEWAEYPYNPEPLTGGEFDSTADPKPSWEELVKGLQLYRKAQEGSG